MNRRNIILKMLVAAIVVPVLILTKSINILTGGILLAVIIIIGAIRTRGFRMEE